ncbi:TetR/AcrR family transcriptional regulator [Streptomyces acidiscabies]|uniref:TetR/AcrR family transcriptional regulator n=1 Tax=Streptomyces acidiscabies TaxID=42234 RepID=UPI0038F6A318
MPTSAPPGNRFERRRAATRNALVSAARQILAETSDTGVGIQAIADRADVGFGSFCNHFESGKGVAPRARRDLERGIATGRFTVGDPVIALSASGGVLLSLVELRLSRPDLHVAKVSSVVARRGDSLAVPSTPGGPRRSPALWLRAPHPDDQARLPDHHRALTRR